MTRSAFPSAITPFLCAVGGVEALRAAEPYPSAQVREGSPTAHSNAVERECSVKHPHLYGEAAKPGKVAARAQNSACRRERRCERSVPERDTATWPTALE